MATSTSSKPARLLIPFDYLEDARSALVAEVRWDTGALKTNHHDLLYDNGCREDRDWPVRTLHKDLQVLEQLLDAVEDTEITADPDVLFHLLERFCRVVAKRLKREAFRYAPPPFDLVRELADRMAWAARRATEIYPEEA